MDNCGRENKNQYVLGYCGFLVQTRVFESIELSFLPVGHTHEDIDQMFSCFSSHFKDNEAPSVTSFMECVSNGYKPNPVVNRIKEIADFKSILEVNDCLHDVEGKMNCF